MLKLQPFKATPFFLMLFGLMGLCYSVEAQDSETEIPDFVSQTYVSAITVDSKGDTYVCGYFEGLAKFGRHPLLSEEYSTDAFLAKYSPVGQCIWAVRIGGSGTDKATDLVVDEQGYVYLIGTFTHPADFGFKNIYSNGATDIFLARYNSSGLINWVTVSGGKGDDEAVALEKVNSGLMVLGNYSQDVRIGKYKFPDVGLGSAALAHYDLDGTVKWAKLIGAGSSDCYATSMARTGEESVAVAGYFTDRIEVEGRTLTTQGGDQDGFILQYAAKEGLSWMHSYASSSPDYPTVLAASKSGDIVIGGRTVKDLEQVEAFMVKLNADGNSQIRKKWDQEDNFDLTFAQFDAADHLVIGGFFNEHLEFGELKLNSYLRDGFLAWFDPELTPINGIAMNTDEGGIATDLCLDAIGSMYMAGGFGRRSGFLEEPLFSYSNSAVQITRFSSDYEPEFEFKAAETVGAETIEPEVVFVNYFGKALTGSTAKKPIAYARVFLVDKEGNGLETAVTDQFGDFAFRSLRTDQSYAIIVRPGDAEPVDGVFLASREGFIQQELKGDPVAGVRYDILSEELAKLAESTAVHPEEQVDNFLKTGKAELLIIENIYYPKEQWEITEQFKEELDMFAKNIRGSSSIYLHITAHTDAMGNEEDNLELSNKRAKAIAEYLIQKRVPESKVTWEGRGESEVLNRCKSEEAGCSEFENAVNRRTEFKLYRKY